MLEERIVAGARPARASPSQIAREFRALVESGVEIRPAGRARRSPKRLLSLGYAPRHRFELFDTTFWLTDPRYDEHIGFFVAYVRLGDEPVVHPRIFYKDVSLVWRSATHFTHHDGERWIGKGELRTVDLGDEEVTHGAEETTNLPLEAQGAFDAISRRGLRGPREDHRAVPLVLRQAPPRRIAPYADFTRPRRRAMSDPRNRVNGGRPIARFARANDPASLRFVPGFEPDFGRGVLEHHDLASRMYGGRVRKYRILSRNRRIQYQFVAAPRHVWIVPPQALTTELSSYGVRTVDVEVPEELCVPGYEYHYEVEDTLHTQIPEGFAGDRSEVDPSRADASAWLERLPVVREFRRRVLGRGRMMAAREEARG